ncbi:MAG TPA: SCO family protein, partial [Candidatus Sulfomarinibacteraceae bacterium]|nr:SCO family protein [Candidatus Sulfomarinibacteraceae bacterium]
MQARSDVPGPVPEPAPSLDGAYRLVVVLAIALVALVALSAIRGALEPAPGPEASTTGAVADPASFLYTAPGPAPELDLTDDRGSAFSIASLAGGPALVFFGYTHCPDVCPATMGTIGRVLTAYDPELRVVFVSVDPERDTVDWLRDYVRYLPAGYTALTGTPAEVKGTADAWGVRYARVETGTPGEYSMSHTAEVYLVDAEGRLRAHFPFGTPEDRILATLRLVAASTPAAGSPGPAKTPATTARPSPATSASPSPATSPAPTEATAMAVVAVSSSVWARGDSPVILALKGPAGRLADTGAAVSVQVTSRDGVPRGAPVAAVAVRPPGVADVSYVAVIDVPEPGWWDLSVTAVSGPDTFVGRGSVAALEPGGSAPLGEAAPGIRTPTLDDVGGQALRITTDPLPDPRLSRTSTADALAAGRPFVLVVDSARFKVTPACGKA